MSQISKPNKRQKEIDFLLDEAARLTPSRFMFMSPDYSMYQVCIEASKGVDPKEESEKNIRCYGLNLVYEGVSFERSVQLSEIAYTIYTHYKIGEGN